MIIFLLLIKHLISMLEDNKKWPQQFLRAWGEILIHKTAVSLFQQ